MALDGGDRSVSHPWCCMPWKDTSSTQLTGGWVGPWESGLAVRN